MLPLGLTVNENTEAEKSLRRMMLRYKKCLEKAGYAVKSRLAWLMKYIKQRPGYAYNYVQGGTQ